MPLGIFSQEPMVWRSEKNTAFNSGEYLEFSVLWQFIPVGIGTLEVHETEKIAGRNAFHMVSRANSTPFFDTFYKVRDINESWMDTESLCSHKFRSNVSEGRFRDKTNFIFDQQAHKYTIIESSKTAEVPAWVNDILSSFYYMRTKDLVVGQSVYLDSHSGDKSYSLEVAVLRMEEVDCVLGKKNCFVIEPKIRPGSGMFNAKGTLYVWITSDEKRIPVLMRSKIAVGSIEARLIKAKFGGEDGRKTN